MEQVAGIEPAPSAWQAEVLAAILYLHIPVHGLGSGPTGLTLLEPTQIK